MTVVVKNLSAMERCKGGVVQSLDQEDPLGKEMATHSSILAWRISQTEEPGKLQSIRLQRVEHNRSDLAHMHAYIIDLQLCSCCIAK